MYWMVGISGLITPLAGKTSSLVKNSRHFVEAMRGIKVQDDEMMASFDVTSLFTNVPVDESVHIIRSKLQDDETLEDRTPLSPNRVAELLEMRLKSTYFSYRGTSMNNGKEQPWVPQSRPQWRTYTWAL